MTSSFLIGITLQTAVLSLAIIEKQGGALLGVRASLFSGISILLFAAMSSLTNEFRYGTFEYTHLGSLGWTRVLLLRSLATSLVCWPAVIAPFLAVAYVAKGQGLVHLFLLACGVFLLLWIIGYWMSYALNLSEQPSTVLPAFKYILLISGLGLIDWSWVKFIAQVTPTYWFLKLAQADVDTSQVLLGLALTIVGWTFVTLVVIRPMVERKMIARWLSGRNT